MLFYILVQLQETTICISEDSWLKEDYSWKMMMDIVEDRLKEVEERQDKELKTHEATLETHEEDIHDLKAEQQNLKTDQQNLEAKVSQLEKSLPHQLSVSPTKKRMVPTVPSNQQGFVKQPPSVIIERIFNGGDYKRSDETRARSTPCKGKYYFFEFKSVQGMGKYPIENCALFLHFAPA